MTDGTGLIERFYEVVIGNCQMNLIDELVVEDIVDHEQGLPGQPPGREGVKFFVNAMRRTWTIRDGAVIRICLCQEDQREEALEAAGLSE